MRHPKGVSVRVIRRPAVAVRKLVRADLRLDPGGDWPADLGNHDKAPLRVDLGTAQRAILGHDSMLGVAKVLDFGE